MKIENLESIVVYDGLQVYYPQFNRFNELSGIAQRASNHEGYFTVNNGIVAYVSEGRYFVTTHTEAHMLALSEAGFTDTRYAAGIGDLYVPFSNWDIPVPADERAVWKELVAAQRAERAKCCLIP